MVLNVQVPFQSEMNIILIQTSYKNLKSIAIIKCSYLRLLNLIKQDEELVKRVLTWTF